MAGFIGESKNQVVSYQLITKLLEKSEIRGIDAAGYWGTEVGKDGHILYHKEPGKSSRFVKTAAWKQIFKYNLNMLLVHARGASKGFGDPATNKNNHPFVSSDYSIGFVHNGRLDDSEYQHLKARYAANSHCDSELLLRIFEAAELYSYSQLKRALGNPENPKRLAGIKDIFTLITEGHMAVAVGERGPTDERMMWLFRNKHRPLWLIDMREYLGQIFFVSDPNIWEDAVYECISMKNVSKTQKLIELPTEEIWYFKVSDAEPTPLGVQKYSVVKEHRSTLLADGKFFNLNKREPRFKVITQLNEQDQISASQHQFSDVVMQPNSSLNDVYVKVYKKCDELVALIEHIRGSSYNLKEEGSISCHDMEQLLQELEQQSQYLTELKAIIE